MAKGRGAHMKAQKQARNRMGREQGRAWATAAQEQTRLIATQRAEPSETEYAAPDEDGSNE